MDQSYIKTFDGIDLFCPRPWNERGWDVINAIANGCGPAGWKNKLVPDKIIGCPVKEACNLHDLEYEIGEDIEQKNAADRSFRNNLIRLIRGRTTTRKFIRTYLLYKRMEVAQEYYEFVQAFGGPSFWDKNKKGE